MKNIKSRMYISIILIAVGVALIVGCMIITPDNSSFWSGMGGALIVVAALRLIKTSLYMRDEDRRKKMDVQAKDERNKYIAGTAAFLGLKYSMLAEGLAVIALYILKMDDFGFAVSMTMCAQLIAYWLSYTIINKRS